MFMYAYETKEKNTNKDQFYVYKVLEDFSVLFDGNIYEFKKGCLYEIHNSLRLFIDYKKLGHLLTDNLEEVKKDEKKIENKKEKEK